MKRILFLLVLFQQLHAVAQNVGIGTSNPTKAKLEVHGAVDATSAIFGGESSGISLQRNWPGIGFNTYYGNGSHRYMSNGYGSLLSLDPTNGFMVLDMFGHGAANNASIFPFRAVVVNNVGSVGIGSGTAPVATLHVARGNGAQGARLEGTNHASLFNSGPEEHTYIRAGKNNGTVFINDIPGSKVMIGGKVGTNSPDPIAPLEVRQNVEGATAMELIEGINFNRWGFLVASNTGNMWLSHNGNGRGIFSSGSGQYSAISDKRLKTNIQELTPVLSKVMQLRSVEYDMIHKSAGEQKNIGFLAQEVRTIFPELVQVNDSAIGYKDIRQLHTLNYPGFSVLAIKAIQEQQMIMDDINKRMQLLEEQNKLLMQLLSK